MKNCNDYEKQKNRALKRKLELVELMGGKCENCGYDKNLASMEFHHLDPNTKSFQLDARHISNTSVSLLMDEVKKCSLLCSNCHRERHNPELKLEAAKLKLSLIGEKNISVLETRESQRKKTICKCCGKKFNTVKGKKYCSSKCRNNERVYPEITEIYLKYDELCSWDKVAKYFNTTRKVIQGIRFKAKKAGSQPDELRRREVA